MALKSLYDGPRHSENFIEIGTTGIFTRRKNISSFEIISDTAIRLNANDTFWHYNSSEPQEVPGYGLCGTVDVTFANKQQRDRYIDAID